MICERCEREGADVLDKKQLHQFYAKAKWTQLCIECQNHFDHLIAENMDMQLPDDTKQLIENEHYYIENGLFVFKEVYHMSKGSCCRNNCRHCVYGYKLVHRAKKKLF